MPVTPTSLPTAITAGLTGALGHIATAWDMINQMTAGWASLVTNSTLASRMADSGTLGAFLNATGMPYYIYADSQTTWPNGGARTVPTGFTGRVIFDSQAYPGHAAPSGLQETPVLDFWDSRDA